MNEESPNLVARYLFSMILKLNRLRIGSPNAFNLLLLHLSFLPKTRAKKILPYFSVRRDVMVIPTTSSSANLTTNPWFSHSFMESDLGPLRYLNKCLQGRFSCRILSVTEEENAMEALKREAKTYADYERLPEGAPFQLIDGELVMSPAPSSFHQIILSELFNALFNFVRPQRLGLVLCSPLDVYFSTYEAFQPDIVFISSNRRQILTEKRIDGAPDLVMEILSPSTGYHDLVHKKAVYEAHKVKEYWIIDPKERQIQVFGNANGKFELREEVRNTGSIRSKLLEGFSVDAGAIFAAIDE